VSFLSYPREVIEHASHAIVRRVAVQGDRLEHDSAPVSKKKGDYPVMMSAFNATFGGCRGKSLKALAAFALGDNSETSNLDVEPGMRCDEG